MKIYDVRGIGASLTGSFSGSFKGLFTGPLDGVAATSSYVQYTNVANKPALVSGSSQITYSGISSKPAGIVSGSSQVLGFNVFATTGSNQFNGNQSITGSLTVSGQVIAQTLNVQQVTSSIVFSSGSNRFGNTLGNTHSFTGSVNITGSLTVNGVSASFSEYVPYTGATAEVNLGTNSMYSSMVYINGDGTGGGGVLNLKKGSTRVIGGNDAANTVSLWSDTAAFGFNDWVSANVRSAKFSLASISNNQTRTYTLPNETGTLALTSNLSAYLPLTGGTLTGALSGTSASFKVNADRNLAIKYDTNITISGQADSGGPESLRIYADTFRIYTATTAVGLTERFTISNTGAATFNSSVTATSETTDSSMIQQWGYNSNTAAYRLRLNTIVSSGLVKYSFDTLNASTAYNNNLVLDRGNVGIGTASPDEPLHIVKSSATTNTYVEALHLEGKTTGTVANGFGPSIGFWGSMTGQNNVELARIAALNTNVAGANGALVFYTRPNAAIQERMRINSGGFLKVSNDGTYNDASGVYHEISASTNDSDLLFARHKGSSPYGLDLQFSAASPNNTTNWFFYATDTTNAKFIIYSNGNAVNRNGSYGAISDIKLKENVEDATPKLDDLMKVKVRNYNLIGDDRKQIGVIAQELEEVFPAMIDESPDKDKDGKDLGTTTKSVKYSVFVPMLIKAIQEQQSQIEILKAEIQLLKQQ